MNRARVVQIWQLITKLGEVIAERYYYCREFGALMILYSEIGGHVLTPFFGHVSFDTHLEVMECRSADGAMVISLQGSCR